MTDKIDDAKDDNDIDYGNNYNDDCNRNGILIPVEILRRY